MPEKSPHETSRFYVAPSVWLKAVVGVGLFLGVQIPLNIFVGDWAGWVAALPLGFIYGKVVR